MTRLRVAAAAAFFATIVTMAPAEIPRRSKEALREEASHIVIGKVKAVYTQERKGGDWHETRGVVEIVVSKTEKGEDIKPGDAVYARFWKKRWTGKGNPPTYGSGHKVPDQDQEVRAHLTRNDGGFDALLPNGIEPLE